MITMDREREGAFMIMILAGLALIIGLMAVWLASVAMKKIDTQSDQLLQGIRSEQRKEVDELKNRLKIVDEKNERMLDRLKNPDSGLESQ